MLEVGDEGGSLAIEGLKAARGWRYRLHRQEQTSRVFLDEGHKDDDSITGWLKSWDAAIDQLDRYSWAKLHPLEIHPEFVDQVSASLKTRLPVSEREAWAAWNELLKQSRPQNSEA